MYESGKLCSTRKFELADAGRRCFSRERQVDFLSTGLGRHTTEVVAE